MRFQLKALRKERKFTQEAFADLTQTKQSVISRVENHGADKLSIPTLLKFAEALDVGLVVRFERIDSVADWYDNLTPAKIAPQNSEDILKEIGKQEAKLQLEFDSKNLLAEILDNTTDASVDNEISGNSTSGFLLGVNYGSDSVINLNKIVNINQMVEEMKNVEGVEVVEMDEPPKEKKKK